MRERVLLVTNMYPSEADPSFGCFVERSAQALRSQGVATDVVALQRRGGAVRKALDFMRFVLRANLALVRGRHDCVYVHQPLHSLLACWPGLMWRPVRLVLNFHGHDLVPVTRRGRALRRLLQHRFCDAHAVIVPSRRFQHLFDAEFVARGAPPSRVFPSGGIADLFFEGKVPRLAERPAGLLFLSRWTEGKGWPEFLQLAERWCRHDPAARITLAGNGPDAARIEAAVAATGLSKQLVLARCTDVATARALYRSHRVFVLPSRYDEALALVNLEAMASGCVVLTADFAAARDYVRPGTNAFVVSRQSFVPSALAVLQRLQADPAAAQAVADAARDAAASFAESRVQGLLPRLMGLQGPATAKAAR